MASQKVQIVDQQPHEPGFGQGKMSKKPSPDHLPTLLEQANEHMTSHHTILNTVENMQANVEEFTEHIDTCNITFKQQIMEKIKELKRTDTNVLTERVEELKGQEGNELNRRNAVFMEKKREARQMEQQRDRNEQIINKWVDQWRVRNYMKKIWKQWSTDGHEYMQEKRSVDFCQAFYERGLLFTAMRHMKLFSQVAGNRMHERRMKERITIEVKATVEQKKMELKFLEALIKELEEKHRIELRKKAILKNQCDQAYLRGVAAISQEAIKMSHSTLDDFYKGMRMPKYDGQNVLAQLKHLQGVGTTHQGTTENAVPPIAGMEKIHTTQVVTTTVVGQTEQVRAQTTSSFHEHVEASKAPQAASAMFNQSFGGNL